MRNLDAIVEKLATAQIVFFQAADAIPCALWTVRPGDDKWSAGEVAAHLIAVEQRIVHGARQASEKPATPVPLLKKLHLPIALVEARVIKRKSPLPVHPSLVCSKEDMIGELRVVRERTLLFLKETRQRDLSEYYWRHPFLGMLNTYKWFEMIAAHEIRHAKQVLEIAKGLLKPVTTAENR